MQTKFKLISVQSRKGGVGKTTVAYNVARHYLNAKDENGKRVNVVLLIDLDVFGTNLVEATDFHEWFKDRHVVNYPAEAVRDKIMDSRGKSLNLIELYHDHFGNDGIIPEFRFVNSEKYPGNHLILINEKVNLIGSSNHIIDKNEKPLEIKPSILYDPIAGYWFMRFVFELVDRFIQCVGDLNNDDNAGNKLAAIVVFDNQPGHIGFAPIMEEIMLDLGPEISKFIFVSTNHMSDLNETFTDVSELHKSLLRRINQCIQINEQNQSTEMSHPFVKRLSEYISYHKTEENVKKEEGIRKSFASCMSNYDYYKGIITNKGETKDLGPWTYLGLVLNKVYREIYTRDHEFSIYPLLKDNDILCQLISRTEAVNYIDIAVKQIYNHMVIDNEMLEWPYLQLQKFQPIKNISKITYFYDPETKFKPGYVDKSLHKRDPIDTYNYVMRVFYRTANRYMIIDRKLRLNRAAPIARVIPEYWWLSGAFNQWVVAVKKYYCPSLSYEWSLGVDSIGATNTLKHLRERDSQIKYDPSDSLLQIGFRTLIFVLFDRFTLTGDDRQALLSMLADTNEVLRFLGEKIDYDNLAKLKTYTDILRTLEAFNNLEESATNHAQFLEEILGILIRFVFCEKYLERYRKLIYLVLRDFNSARGYESEKGKNSLFLSSAYLIDGENFFFKQLINDDRMSGILDKYEKTPPTNWEMIGFESVISYLESEWS